MGLRPAVPRGDRAGGPAGEGGPQRGCDGAGEGLGEGHHGGGGAAGGRDGRLGMPLSGRLFFLRHLN